MQNSSGRASTWRKRALFGAVALGVLALATVPPWLLLRRGRALGHEAFRAYHERGAGWELALRAQALLSAARRFPGWAPVADAARAEVTAQTFHGVVTALWQSSIERAPPPEELGKLEAEWLRGHLALTRVPTVTHSLWDRVSRVGFHDLATQAAREQGWPTVARERAPVLRAHLLRGMLAEMRPGFEGALPPSGDDLLPPERVDCLLGDFAPAAAALERALGKEVEAFPTSALAKENAVRHWVALTECALRGGKNDLVLRALARFADDPGERCWAGYFRARVALAGGQVDGALQALEQAGPSGSALANAARLGAHLELHTLATTQRYEAYLEKAQRFEKHLSREERARLRLSAFHPWRLLPPGAGTLEDAFHATFLDAPSLWLDIAQALSSAPPDRADGALLQEQAQRAFLSAAVGWGVRSDPRWEQPLARLNDAALVSAWTGFFRTLHGEADWSVDWVQTLAPRPFESPWPAMSGASSASLRTFSELPDDLRSEVPLQYVLDDRARWGHLLGDLFWSSHLRLSKGARIRSSRLPVWKEDFERWKQIVAREPNLVLFF